MWDEENRLLRTLQLNAVPERLAYSVFGGDVFLGIREGLYVMSCTKFLPPNYQQTEDSNARADRTERGGLAVAVAQGGHLGLGAGGTV
ncbi:WD repeat-containing protein 97 [Maylandia zebra]|uniref:WD repeat-containing protein 97 n=1 Tax=Maylandia zebra TaxID=106582 RepID=UPI00403CF334